MAELILKKRTTSVPIYNAISDIVGEVLAGNPNIQFRIAQVHQLVNEKYEGRYTENQCSKGLRWQAEQNGQYIKTKLVPYSYDGQKIRKNLRFYWYESDPTLLRHSDSEPSTTAVV